MSFIHPIATLNIHVAEIRLWDASLISCFTTFPESIWAVKLHDFTLNAYNEVKFDQLNVKFYDPLPKPYLTNSNWLETVALTFGLYDLYRNLI